MKKILFIILIFFQYNQLSAKSNYKDSVFSICFLKLKASFFNILNRNTMRREDVLKKLIDENDQEIFKHDFVEVSRSTAFYIGNGRFVTNFSAMLYENDFKGVDLIVAKHKDKMIHIDKILQYNSFADLLVLYTSDGDISHLKALEIASSENNNKGSVLSGFDYEKGTVVDILLTLDDFIDQDFHSDIALKTQQLKQGMNGSPLLLQDKVVGITWGIGSTIKYLTRSSYLVDLFKEKEINCSPHKCLKTGTYYLMRSLKVNNSKGELKATLATPTIHGQTYFIEKIKSIKEFLAL